VIDVSWLSVVGLGFAYVSEKGRGRTTESIKAIFAFHNSFQLPVSSAIRSKSEIFVS
jgi:hypothetical protein